LRRIAGCEQLDHGSRIAVSQTRGGTERGGGKEQVRSRAPLAKTAP
jgi:hypothetical protein